MNKCLFFVLLCAKCCTAELEESPCIISISSNVTHVDGDILRLHGSGLMEPVYCVYHYKVKRGPSTERVKAVVHNGSSAECSVPRTPYRIVMHHQHRLPWPGCSWDERCMANSFTLSIEARDVVLKSFNMSYYYGSFSNPISGDSADSAVLQQHLFNLNHPQNCYNTKVLLMKNPTHMGQCTGIGMVFYSHYITALKEAYEQGRALVFSDPFSLYCYYSDKKEENYILAPSNCTMDNINMSLTTTFKAEKAWFASISSPLQFKLHEHTAVSWYRSNFLKYLLRYTSSFQSHLDQAKARINLQTPCIGVHLRRGERGNLGFSTVWLADYPIFDMTDAIRLLRELKARFAVQTVVLATDEPQFFNDIPQYAGEFRILHDALYKRAQGGRDCVRETIAGCTPGVNASTVIKTILTEIYLLSQCNFYAGTLTSTFSKLTVDYMSAQNDKIVAVSLE